jgi:hypothetical protein
LLDPGVPCAHLRKQWRLRTETKLPLAPTRLLPSTTTNIMPAKRSGVSREPRSTTLPAFTFFPVISSIQSNSPRSGLISLERRASTGFTFRFFRCYIFARSSLLSFFDHTSQILCAASLSFPSSYRKLETSTGIFLRNFKTSSYKRVKIFEYRRIKHTLNIQIRSNLSVRRPVFRNHLSLVQ